MSFRKRGRAMPPTITCKNHPGIEAQDKEKRLCKNCLAYTAQGKSLQERARPKAPPDLSPPAARSAGRR